MSAATSNLHDQFHAMLQNMKQTAPPAPASPLPVALSGGQLPLTPSAGSSVVSVPQKDNIGMFFKKHWGKILALCIIVVVVTVFVARYFISKRKKNRKLKEASQDQENIQWEQYFAEGTQPPQQQITQPAQQQPTAAVQAQQGRPSQRGVPPQIQQISAQLQQGQQAPQSHHPAPQPQAHHPAPQPQAPPPPAPPQRVPPLSAVQVPPSAPAAPAAPAAVPPAVDPRLAAAGITLPQRQPKEKEADIPKPDTDLHGKKLENAAPAGKVVDEIVVA